MPARNKGAANGKSKSGMPTRIGETTMNDSPYAPPRAALVDVEPSEEPMERPWQVARAVICLWIMFGIGVANSLWTVVNPSPQLAMFNRPVLFVYFTLIFLVSAWIYRAIGKGRNWARIVYLVLAGISLLGIPFMAFGLKVGTTTPMAATLGVVNVCVSVYAAYLLLTAPSRQWYRNMKGRQG
jgi:hypothetical protein